MPEKQDSKDQGDSVLRTEVFIKQKGTGVVITTGEPRPVKKKGKLLTTRDLPSELPNYHK